jgi:hypothetical protein
MIKKVRKKQRELHYISHFHNFPSTQKGHLFLEVYQIDKIQIHDWKKEIVSFICINLYSF